MGKIAIDADVLAQVKHLADAGDKMAVGLNAVFAAVRVLSLSAGVEGATVANVIRVSGQVQTLDGLPNASAHNIMLTSVPIAGVGTMTIGTKGTIKKGSGTTSVWLQCDSTGAFEIDVLNASVEDNLLICELDNGETETLKLTFA